MCKLVTIELRAQGAAVGELEATLPATRGSGKRSRNVSKQLTLYERLPDGRATQPDQRPLPPLRLRVHRACHDFLPSPVSPPTNTVVSVGATRATAVSTARRAALPQQSWNQR